MRMPAPGISNGSGSQSPPHSGQVRYASKASSIGPRAFGYQASPSGRLVVARHITARPAGATQLYPFSCEQRAHTAHGVPRIRDELLHARTGSIPLRQDPGYSRGEPVTHPLVGLPAPRSGHGDERLVA